MKKLMFSVIFVLMASVSLSQVKDSLILDETVAKETKSSFIVTTSNEKIRVKMINDTFKYLTSLRRKPKEDRLGMYNEVIFTYPLSEKERILSILKTYR